MIIMHRIRVPESPTVFTSRKSGRIQSVRCSIEPRLAETLAIPRVKRSDPARLIIQSSFAGAISRIQANEPEIRRGAVEGVHRLRTATRRLRGELRAFRRLLSPVWRKSIEIDLKWLAAELGGVRELDVLDERLRTAAARLCWDGPRRNTEIPPAAALEPLFESIHERHAAASEDLQQALGSHRYSQLVDAVGRSLDPASDVLLNEAEAPCREVLPPLVRAAWKHLERGARALSPDDPDDDFHEVRKRSKRARYTAELIAPALGRDIANDAARFVRLTTHVQDVLGEHQDAIDAIGEIERVRAEHSRNPLFLRAADLLIKDQKKAADSARDSFFGVWKKLDRKKVRRWMKSK
jgi:CHAD domain-containing protein